MIYLSMWAPWPWNTHRFWSDGSWARRYWTQIYLTLYLRVSLVMIRGAPAWGDPGAESTSLICQSSGWPAGVNR